MQVHLAPSSSFLLSSIAGWTSRRLTLARSNQVGLAGAGRHEYRVDRVDDAVGRGDVGDDYLGVSVQEELAALEGQLDLLALDCLDRGILLRGGDGGRARHLLREDVVGEHLLQQRLVARYRGVRFRGGLLQLRERRVGRCEDGVRPFGGEGADEASLLHERDQGREPGVAGRDSDDRVVHRPLLGGCSGCGGCERRRRDECHSESCEQCFHAKPPSIMDGRTRFVRRASRTGSIAGDRKQRTMRTT